MSDRLANDLTMRTCSLHPYRLAATQTGHVHLWEDLKVVCGWCKECHKNEMMDTIDSPAGCDGCFGRIGGLR